MGKPVVEGEANEPRPLGVGRSVGGQYPVETLKRWHQWKELRARLSVFLHGVFGIVIG